MEEHECERERQRMIQCVVCLLELLVQVGFVTPSTTAYLRHTTHTHTCSLTLLLSAFSPLPPSRTHSHSKPNTHIYTYTHLHTHNSLFLCPHTLSSSLSHSLTHTLCLQCTSPKYMLTNTHTHTHTHTVFSHPCPFSYPLRASLIRGNKRFWLRWTWRRCTHGWHCSHRRRKYAGRGLG